MSIYAVDASQTDRDAKEEEIEKADEKGRDDELSSDQDGNSPADVGSQEYSPLVEPMVETEDTISSQGNELSGFDLLSSADMPRAKKRSFKPNFVQVANAEHLYLPVHKTETDFELSDAAEKNIPALRPYGVYNRLTRSSSQ